MSEASTAPQELGFARTFVIPALWVFLVPVLGYLFFTHAENSHDDEFREAIRQQLRFPPDASAEERATAFEQLRDFRMSQFLREDPETSKRMAGDAAADFAQFRWMKFIAAACVLSALGAFLFVAVSIPLSVRSQQTQFLSLSTSWHMLKIVSALQVIGQGVLLVALSYWVTALWMNVFIVKLIFFVGLLALVAVGAILKAIFTKPNMDFHIRGTAIEKDQAAALWQDLESICEKVGTKPPDQIIGGIDDSFFVSEQPMFVNEKPVDGRTLFVSLSLLKQLNGRQADAVMAHEMAHFSGNDTVFSRKIAPLLARYDTYLGALREGGITTPVFHFMLCFRALFELSLGKLSREREFRADRIAAEVTSPEDFSSALVRIIGFSMYRGELETELFEQEDTAKISDIAQQIQGGFHSFAVKFASSDDDIGNLQSSHPFDRHPATTERLAALGVTLTPEAAQQMLTADADGAWFKNIDSASHLEKDQWDEYERMFREVHEQHLCYRYLPATPEERAIVLRHFPNVSFDSKDGAYEIDMDGLSGGKLKEAIAWSEVTSCSMNDQTLVIVTASRGSKSINTSRLGRSQQEFLQCFQLYYGRYLSAKQIAEEAAAPKDEPE